MIYLLEDDDSIRKLVIYALQSQGYEAAGFERPSEFWHAMGRRLPELVLLDVMLPEEDGLSVLKKLRSATATAAIPVIMLTAKNTEFDRVTGLDCGADDFVSKPFGMMELLARVRAVLRRTEKKPQEQQWQVGPLQVYPQRRQVQVNGREVMLTYKEFELLRLFLSHPGMAFTRDQLFNEIWGMDYCGETRTVDMHIRTLRQKLGSCGSMIQTVRNVGYRLEVGA